jgi:hypothetical protein
VYINQLTGLVGRLFLFIIFYILFVFIIVTGLTNYRSYYCNCHDIDRLQQLSMENLSFRNCVAMQLVRISVNGFWWLNTIGSNKIRCAPKKNRQHTKKHKSSSSAIKETHVQN